MSDPRSDVAALLEVGALLPQGTALPPDTHADTVDARTFVHPAMPGRVVVRLVPDALAAGAEVEMGTLGFSAGAHYDNIALRQRRSLGFPGWCLLHDPARARYALDVMREFKVEARRAASKPGHARDGFNALGDRLARQVPHFLPSFWEEVGRAFVLAGNTTYAASAFDRARQAEAEFGLAIDHAARAEVYLEFALAGALTVKSLQAYGKDLLKAVGAEAAYEGFYTLAVRRTLGGLTPWASLPKDLRSLAKAAKRASDKEDQRFIRDVLDSGGLVRAPVSFWADYRDALVTVARAEPRLLRRILDIFPKGGADRWSGEHDMVEPWMGILRDTGALALITSLDTPSAALPTGGRAAWYSRFYAWVPAGQGVTLAVLRALAPALVADGVPVPAPSDEDHHDPDLFDLMIDLGVPFGWADHISFNLRDWAGAEPVPAAFGLPEEARPRALSFAMTDPRVAGCITPAVGAAMGEESFERVSRARPALRQARHDWMAAHIAALQGQGLLEAARTVETLSERVSAAALGEFPDLVETFAAVDLSRSLARTLVAGVLDELTWPQWESAWAELRGPKQDQEVHVSGAFPRLALWNDRRAIVLGAGDGSVTNGGSSSHDLKLPSGVEPETVEPVGAHLRVSWLDPKLHKRLCYWSNRPKDHVECEYHRHDREVEDRVEILLPSGAVSWGAAPVSPGEGGVLAHRHAHLEGGRAWVGVWEKSWAWRELELSTGKLLPASTLPAFLADVSPDLSRYARYHPVPVAWGQGNLVGAVERSPGQWQLGQKSTTVRAPDAPVPAEDDEDSPTFTRGSRLDGVSMDHVGAGALLVDWPGGGGLRVVSRRSASWGGYEANVAMELPLGAPGANLESSRTDTTLPGATDDDEGAPLVGWVPPPLAWWSAIRPRHTASSLVLRGLSDARPLLDAALGGDDAAIEQAVRSHLPELTNPEIRAAVVRNTRYAAGLERKLRALQTREAEAPDDEVSGGLSDSDARDALGTLGLSGRGSDEELGRSIGVAVGFLSGTTGLDAMKSDTTTTPWWRWVGVSRALAWAAIRPGLTPEQYNHGLALLRAWRDADITRLRGVRRIALAFSEKENPFLRFQSEYGDRYLAPRWWVVEGDHRYVVWARDTWTQEPPLRVDALEAAGASGFLLPAGATLEDEQVLQPEPDTNAWLDALLEVVGARGARPSTEADAAILMRHTGLSRAEAIYLLACLPKHSGWGHDFMGKALREAIGLKVNEAKAAKAGISVSTEGLTTVMHAALPDDPARIWDAPPDAPDSVPSRLAAAWVALKGRRVPVPEELLLRATKELGRGFPVAELFQLVNDPDAHHALNHDGRWGFDDDGDLVRKDLPAASNNDDDEDHDEAEAAPEPFDSSLLENLARFVPWLVHACPANDPLLARLPDVVNRLQKRLSNPDLYLQMSWYRGDAKASRAQDALLTVLGGKVRTVGDAELRETPAIVTKRSQWHTELSWRPARLDPSSLETLARFALASDSVVELARYEMVVGPGWMSLVERAARSPLPAGAWEHNPSQSAPEVVKAAAGTLKISAEAATLYLQTLVLASPQKKLILLYNGWSARTYAQAAAELVSRGLLLEAKRARAGREHFLPGVWNDSDTPTEAWKLPLYRLRGVLPAGELLPIRPLHTLYAEAWARITAGDTPRFEEAR